ncbi:MAG: class I SAM-dependent methyltransferase [Candidatus Lokiarchaeota archaeon]|nr:class I SAM-dependent methyltransferase [Candidatus Lokiarchaeota archaeon]
MDEIRARFDKDAPVYDFDIVRLIPYYEKMLNTTIKSIPFNPTENIRILDLGCGTGNLTRKVKLAFPNSKITCLDNSPQMVEQAREKLKEFDEITFLIQDFNELSFQENYNVIISSLALHHLVSDDEKKCIYRKIYHSLNNKGVFLNFDNLLGSNDSVQKQYLTEWTDFLRKSFPEEHMRSILE